MEGTCEWIEDNPTYRFWLEATESSLLWILGGPGKGKTMLSIHLTQKLEEERNRGQVIYFFCVSGNEAQGSSTAVLRSLLWQIMTKQPKLARHLQDDFESEQRTKVTLNSFEPLWRLFITICNDPEFNPVICVIDGLDECDETSAERLARSLTELSARDTRRVCKTIVVSRENSSLRRSEATTRIQMDPDNDLSIESDIAKFVSAKVNELLKTDLPGFDDGLGRTVKRTLLEKSEGTFLWAGFAMGELLTKGSRGAVEHALRELPRGLPKLYDRMLEQVEEHHERAVLQILKWVALSIRPLTIGELASAICTSPTPEEEDIEYYVCLCKPFLIVQMRGYQGAESVHLVHQSAREYLTRSIPSGRSVKSRLHLPLQERHLDLACNSLDFIHA